MVAVALEDTCRSVITAALRVLGSEATNVCIVHAYHVPFEGFVTPAARAGEMTGWHSEFRRAAVSKMERLCASLGDFGVRWTTVVARGDERAVIPAATVTHRADLVVVGTHGRSGVAHALLGSTAEAVIRTAACDVLVVRTPRVSFELP